MERGKNVRLGMSETVRLRGCVFRNFGDIPSTFMDFSLEQTKSLSQMLTEDMAEFDGLGGVDASLNSGNLFRSYHSK